MSVGSICSENGPDPIAGNAFAPLNLGVALIEMLVDGLFVLQKPIFLIFKERKSMSDDFGRLAVMATIDLTLNSLFRGGIEGQSHGESIARVLRLPCAAI